jgi:hypothetical protein
MAGVMHADTHVQTDPRTQAFGYPFMYWVGMDTAPDADPAAIVEFSRFYTHVHAPEVIAGNPGFARATRYELVEPDPRGDFGPRWLAMYEMNDEAAAQTYIERNDNPSATRPTYTPRPPAWQDATTKWRMLWRKIAERGSASEPPYSIFMVGMNIPADTDAAGLAQFNAFYSDTHVPEVMAAGGYARGTRFELYREFLHPTPGAPHFCAIYEADQVATEARALSRGGHKLSAGPPVWDKHDTLWRLVYRRIRPEDV